MSSRKVLFPRKVEISTNDEDFFYDTLFERIRTVWPSLSSYEAEILEVTLIELGYIDAAYVASRLESQDLTAVSESYVFVQRWAVPNVWKWIITPELEERGIPVKDFPLNYDPAHSDFKVLAWREKMDGVPYVMENNHLTGERQISGASVRVLVPPDLSWIVYAERVRDVFYVLYPYKNYVGQFESNGISYTVKSHKWRSGRIENCKEGAILLTDRGEYRLKSFPTAEIKRGDQVWEVGLQGQKLINIRPRYTSKYRTEMDALSYLSRQPFLRMYDLYVEEQEEFSADVHYTVTRSLGDGITISGGKISESEEYANVSRIYTSAKALIQDKYGRFLLIQEGSKMWDLPGGKCNFLSEPPSQILRRELKEELDWDIPWRILFFKNIRYTEGSVVFLYHFVVNPTSISSKSNIRWVTVEEYLSLSQREMVSWLPSLFTDIVTIDRHFSYYSEEKEYRLIQRCKPGTIVSSPLDESRMTDMAGNPVEFTDGKCRYIHPVIPGSGELWHQVSKEIIAVAQSSSANNDSDLTCPAGEAHHWLTHPEKRKFAQILQVFAKSDVFLYHEFMRNTHRLWGRRLSVGALSFVRSPDDHVTYVWTREFSHSWINFIYYEKAVTIQEIQAYFPEIKQPDLDQKVNAGILQVKRIGHWNYYTVV